MIERWLEDRLEAFGWSKVERLQASSHLAWGIVFPFVFGWWGLACWLGWTAYKELVVDGHLTRIRAGTETRAALVDFAWDLATRTAGSVLYVVLAVVP